MRSGSVTVQSGVDEVIGLQNHKKVRTERFSQEVCRNHHCIIRSLVHSEGKFVRSPSVQELF